MKLSVSFALLLFFTSAAAQAADFDNHRGGICHGAVPLELLELDRQDELRDFVVDRMNESIDVANDPQWINSRSQAFTWANETKAYCGIAYGELQLGYTVDETVGKCGCFYERMISKMRPR